MVNIQPLVKFLPGFAHYVALATPAQTRNKQTYHIPCPHH